MHSNVIQQQKVRIIKDKGGFHDPLLNQLLDCGYLEKERQSLSKIYQQVGCGFVDIGDPVPPGTPNSIDTVVLGKPGEQDVWIPVGQFDAFHDACVACCL